MLITISSSFAFLPLILDDRPGGQIFLRGKNTNRTTYPSHKKNSRKSLFSCIDHCKQQRRYSVNSFLQLRFRGEILNSTSKFRIVIIEIPGRKSNLNTSIIAKVLEVYFLTTTTR